MSFFTPARDNKLKIALTVVLFLVLFIILFLYVNKVAPISWGLYGDVNTENGVAHKGADVVSYFSESKYVPGVAEISVSENGVIWFFATEANKQIFIKAPEKFMPQYGGYCAFAISQNVTADVKPEFWAIQGNKVYLFNNSEAKDEWLKNIPEGSLTASDKNWSARM